MIRLSLLVLAGCATDFGLQQMTGPEAMGDDTAAPEDTTSEPQDEDTGDTGEPYEPAEDEGEPSTEEDPPEDDCTETSDLIYVVDRDNSMLYLFDPNSQEFTPQGRLTCGGGSPGSMAVSRSGTAYVRYSDESLYAVDLADLSCTRTEYRSPNGFGSFGMGYATDDADTWRDELYIADADRVGQLNTGTWELDLLGNMSSQSELTGNSAGELWAFLPLESPAALAELDKDTGAERQRIRLNGFPDLGDIDAFAFAAWGGEFWLFVRTYGMGSSTDVYRVGEDGVLQRVLEDVGFDVVGAGVSTCAPSE
ncbi:MAG: hypothetical protein ACI8RZ_000746 [Myxococcota bacterium]|jgi:hypothetical protein